MEKIPSPWTIIVTGWLGFMFATAAAAAIPQLQLAGLWRDVGLLDQPALRQRRPPRARNQHRGRGRARPREPVKPVVRRPDPVDQLARLATLRDRGVLTDAEFASEKAKILAQP